MTDAEEVAGVLRALDEARGDPDAMEVAIAAKRALVQRLRPDPDTQRAGMLAAAMDEVAR